MVTVTDVLHEPGLALDPVHLPHADVAVRWVATSELADPTPFLQGGEVLLTTGLGTADRDAEWAPYVARLVETGVAALGLGVGLTHEAVPAGLVAACRDRGLNLFVVPRPTAFVAVSRAVAALLETAQERVTRRSLDAQQALTKAALETDDTGALLTRLAALVDGAAALVDRDGRVLRGPEGPSAADLDGATVADEVAHIRGQGLRAAASSATGSGTTIVQPLGVRSRPESWLAVLVPGRPDEPHLVAIGAAVSLLGLAQERARERRTTDRALRSRSLATLLDGDPETSRILLEAAGGWLLPSGTVRVLRARGPSDALDDLLADLEGRRLLAVRAGEELVVVCPARRAQTIAAAAADAVLVGVGGAVGLAQAAESHESAGQALASATDAARIRVWDDLVHGGVLELVGPGAVAYGRSFLAPLSGALRDTLRAYLQHHGSVGDTAADLGVHRNTVRNRVREIESLLGRPLDEPATRVDAWVALSALR